MYQISQQVFSESKDTRNMGSVKLLVLSNKLIKLVFHTFHIIFVYPVTFL